jgi:hypothetical protein
MRLTFAGRIACAKRLSGQMPVANNITYQGKLPRLSRKARCGNATVWRETYE